MKFRNEEKIMAIIVKNDMEEELIIDNTIENVVAFITRSTSTNIMLYSLDEDEHEDTFILDTFGTFLNKCDADYREWIISDLVAVQCGEKEPIQNIKFDFEEVEGFTRADYVSYVSNDFEYDLDITK